MRVEAVAVAAAGEVEEAGEGAPASPSGWTLRRAPAF